MCATAGEDYRSQVPRGKSSCGAAGTNRLWLLRDHRGVALFAASDDGQWAGGILKWAGQADPVPIFE